ncbi:hypothetical protein BDW59DRAFT_107263 [Aspergillus cavernicola]|uniref:Secreted protein n=1 Tax=Aspergillus cavernicola TaxID=176166 RepID=A0ABR4I393_9EURO
MSWIAVFTSSWGLLSTRLNTSHLRHTSKATWSSAMSSSAVPQVFSERRPWPLVRTDGQHSKLRWLIYCWLNMFFDVLRQTEKSHPAV